MFRLKRRLALERKSALPSAACTAIFRAALFVSGIIVMVPAVATEKVVWGSDIKSSPCDRQAGLNSFSDAPPVGGILVGVIADSVQSGNRQVVDSITPLFAFVGADGKLGDRSQGRVHGAIPSAGQKTYSENGYVVVGVKRASGTMLDGMQLVYRKWGQRGVEAGTDKLSPWIGGQGGGQLADWVAPDGFVVISLDGAAGTYGDGTTHVGMVCVNAQSISVMHSKPALSRTVESIDQAASTRPQRPTGDLSGGLGGTKAGSTGNSSGQGAGGTLALPPPSDQTDVVAAVGLGMLLLVMFVVFRRTNLNEQQMFVVRVVLALAGGAFGAAIPGLFNFHSSSVQAGGALGLVALIYLITPGLVGHKARH